MGLENILTQLWVVLTSKTFLIILLAFTILAWGTIQRFFRRTPLNRNRIIALAIIGLFFAYGGASMIGVGSTASLLGASAIDIDRLQTTTAYNFTNGTIVSDSGDDDTRQSDFYVNTMGANGWIDAGVFLLTRSGKLDANSCNVRVIKPARYEISDTTYHIVNEDATTGVMTAYVHTGSTTGVATTSDPKETNVLAFAEGVAQGYVSYYISIDATGFDALSQYDSKTIVTDNCGYPYKFKLIKND